MKKEGLDYIIVGQGISGSILAYEFMKSGKSFVVIDRPSPHVSSRVAAGIFNPITGRRVVKSWKVDSALPFAREYYTRAESDLNVRFFHPMDSLEIIKGVKEANDWTERMDDPSMRSYFREKVNDTSVYKSILKEYKKIVRISDSGWMNIPAFLLAIEERLQEEGALFIDQLDPSKVEVTNDHIRYRNFEAKKIIYCQGYHSASNPLWKFIPFLPAKGEILTIHCAELPQEFILLSGLFLIPLGNAHFRAGSTYEWNFADELPSEAGRKKLSEQLQDLLKVPFRITDHQSGIRPTIQDRRPVIGAHPDHSNVFIFGGLGTKGVMLGPYFAHQLIAHLEKGEAISEETNVRRFLR